MSDVEKNILVLSRRNHDEAMRVASGLTIFGHQVSLVFMDHPLSEEEAASDHVELLELCDIEPVTTVTELADDLDVIDPVRLGEAIVASDMVINV